MKRVVTVVVQAREAITAASIAVPAVAIGLFSGTYVDRRDRRRIMIVADASRAVLLAALAILTFSTTRPAHDLCHRLPPGERGSSTRPAPA